MRISWSKREYFQKCLKFLYLKIIDPLDGALTARNLSGHQRNYNGLVLKVSANIVSYADDVKGIPSNEQHHANENVLEFTDFG